MTLPDEIFNNRTGEHGQALFWDTKSVHALITQDSNEQTLRTTERLLESSGLLPACLKLEDIRDEFDRNPILKVVTQLDKQARQKRFLSLVIQQYAGERTGWVLFANDGRMGRRWLYLHDITDAQSLLVALKTLAGDKNLVVWPHGQLTTGIRQLVHANGGHDIKLDAGNIIRLGTVAYQGEKLKARSSPVFKAPAVDGQLTNLDRLEAESIHIMREAVAQADNPVMLYSCGKDSSVMLHLARKAFSPGPLPFPLLHIDTRWKFQALYEFRDDLAKADDVDLIVHVNQEGVHKDINPFDHGSALHTSVMKTGGLIQAMQKHQFDIALGGARRDEEKSCAKERVFSPRASTHHWDPKNQRPEIWNLYNSHKNKDESIRVFPLSNWTELEIWQYIYREQIPLVSLYFAAERAVVERHGLLLMVDDDRFELFDNENIRIKKVRFRSLGCYPLSGAIESNAEDLPSIIHELLQSKQSERLGRSIDHDSHNAMEKKKLTGYF